MDYVAMGRRIRQARIQRGMTQEELSEHTGMSTSFVGHIERGSRKASLETFVKLCTALQTDPGWLLAAEFVPALPGGMTKEMQNNLRLLLEYACELTRKAE